MNERSLSGISAGGDGSGAARLIRSSASASRTADDDVLINMIFVHVEMGIMQIVNAYFMAYCRMPTIGTVLVRMIRMMILIASGHCDFPSFLAGR